MTTKIRGYLQEMVTEKVSTKAKNEVKLVSRINLIFYSDFLSIPIYGFSIIELFKCKPSKTNIQPFFD